MHFKTASEAMAALKEGTVAAVMAPVPIWKRDLEKTGKVLKSVRYWRLDWPVSEWDLGMAVKADNLELLTAAGNAMSEMLMMAPFKTYSKDMELHIPPLRGK